MPSPQLLGLCMSVCGGLGVRLGVGVGLLTEGIRIRSSRAELGRSARNGVEDIA
jgi:hypothetical protein